MNASNLALRLNAGVARRSRERHAGFIRALNTTEGFIQKVMRGIRGPIERTGSRIDSYVVKSTKKAESKVKGVLDHKPIKKYLGG